MRPLSAPTATPKLKNPPKLSPGGFELVNYILVNLFVHLHVHMGILATLNKALLEHSVNVFDFAKHWFLAPWFCLVYLTIFILILANVNNFFQILETF